MEKAYNEIVFKNNQSPDLDEDNLNRISHGLSTVDDRVIQLKGDLTELDGLIETGGNNIFNPAKLISGYGYTDNGELVKSSNYKCTSLLPFKYAKGICQSSVRAYKILFFDKDKNFLYVIKNIINAHINTNYNSAYVALMYAITDDISNLMICWRGSTQTSLAKYEPYYYKINEDKLVIKNYDIVNGKFFDSIKNDVADYIKTDVDNVDMIEIPESSSTKIVYNAFHPCTPLNVIIVEFLGKANKINDDGLSAVGGAIDIRFYDDNDVMVGTKYNAEILSSTRFGYHKYGYIVPLGAIKMNIRIFSRANTLSQFKELDVYSIKEAPIRKNTTVTYDCHLGQMFSAPKNTMPAFELAKKSGYGTIILNIKSTSDGVLVALHDENIDSTSDGSGKVSSYTFEELQSFDFGSWFSPYYTGTRIPKVEDVVSMIASYGMDIMFSIHPTNTAEEFEKLYDLCKKYNLLNRCSFKAYYTSQLESIRNVFGSDTRYILIKTSPLTEEDIIWINAFDELNYIEFDNYNVITEENVMQCKNLNLEVIGTFTFQPGLIRKAIKCGVSRFTCDLFSDNVFPLE